MLDKVQIDTLEIVFIESPEAELAAYMNMKLMFRIILAKKHWQSIKIRMNM